MPIALAYGEKDAMIPPHQVPYCCSLLVLSLIFFFLFLFCFENLHFFRPNNNTPQGFMLSAMAGSEIPIYILADGPHNPLHIREGLLFSKMLPLAFKNAKRVTNSSSWLAELPSSRDGLKFELGTDFHATFSRDLTHQAIHRLYDQLLSYRRGKKLRLPGAVVVDACEKPLPLLKVPLTFLVDKDGNVSSVDVRRYLDDFKDILSSHFIDDDDDDSKKENEFFTLSVTDAQ